jgi:hypothetical protein
MEVNDQLHAPAPLPPGKETPVPIAQEAGWAPDPVWKTWRRENPWPYRNSNSDLSVVQPVTSRYTDYAIPTPTMFQLLILILKRKGWHFLLAMSQAHLAGQLFKTIQNVSTLFSESLYTFLAHHRLRTRVQWDVSSTDARRRRNIPVARYVAVLHT